MLVFHRLPISVDDAGLEMTAEGDLGCLASTVSSIGLYFGLGTSLDSILSF